jgi:hypothetical protein
VTEGWTKMQNEKLYNMHSLLNTIKEDVMDEAHIMHRRDKKCKQNSG